VVKVPTGFSTGGRLRCGVASEIAATVSEKTFDSLKAAIARVARADTPVSNSQPQEGFISPAPEKVVEAAKRVVRDIPAAAA
jgi:pyruvate/2-oxoglutarate/acetoin dehydrogenase E1 component